ARNVGSRKSSTQPTQTNTAVASGVVAEPAGESSGALQPDALGQNKPFADKKVPSPSRCPTPRARKGGQQPGPLQRHRSAEATPAAPRTASAVSLSHSLVSRDGETPHSSDLARPGPATPTPAPPLFPEKTGIVAAVDADPGPDQ